MPARSMARPPFSSLSSSLCMAASRACEVLQMFTGNLKGTAARPSKPIGPASIPAPISSSGGGAPCTMASSRIAFPIRRGPACREHFRPRPFAQASAEKFEVLFRPDRAIYDGRFANNGWLQELPGGLSQAPLGQRAIVQFPEPPTSLGVDTGDMLQLDLPGTVPCARRRGFNPATSMGRLPCTSATGAPRAGRAGPASASIPRLAHRQGAVAMTPAWRQEGRRPVTCSATTQNEHMLDARRHIFPRRRISRIQEEPRVRPRRIGGPAPRPDSLPRLEVPGHAWGMAIDLTFLHRVQRLRGACQAETTSLSSAKIKSAAAAPCTGCASIVLQGRT